MGYKARRVPHMDNLCIPGGYFWGRTSENSVTAKFAEASKDTNRFHALYRLKHAALKQGLRRGSGQLSALIHRSAWKGNSQKSISRIVHGLPLWEQRMAYGPTLELIAKHKVWEQCSNVNYSASGVPARATENRRPLTPI
jgi:hypothetical protein